MMLLSSHFFDYFGFVLMSLITRLAPHPPNFTSMHLLALFGIFYLENRLLCFLFVFLAMFSTDVFLGWHSTLPFVYLSLACTICVGQRLHSQKSLKNAPTYLVLSSTLFFMITNAGVWLTTSLYPKTVSGLCLCYIAALPFFTNQLLGDFLYGFLLTAWVQSRANNPEFVPISKNYLNS